MPGKADGSVLITSKMDTKGFKTGFANVQNDFNNGVVNVKKAYGGLSASIGKLAKVMAGVFAVKQLISFGKESIELGSDLEEVQNVVDVTFGNLNGEINEFARNAIEQFGLSEIAAKRYSSTIGAMLKSMGFANREAADMSKTMTGLAGDIASFYNLSADEAFYKIRAGISGETEPLKQLGINLNVANLEQYALTQGIKKSYNAMTQQEQALLRYNYLLSVTSDAQGDFARTSDSWANQTRILSERFNALKATIGQGLINVLTPVIKLINILLARLQQAANVFKAFSELITGNKSSANSSSGILSGEDYSAAAGGAEDYADATEDVAKATKKAKKETEQYLSGLDEIRQYESPDTESQGGDSLSGALGNVDYGSLAGGEIGSDITISPSLQKVIDTLSKFFENLKRDAEPARKALSNLKNSLKPLGKFVFTSLYDFYKKFLEPVGKWTLGEGIPRFVDAISNGLNTIDWGNINNSLGDLWDKLAPFAVNVGDGLLWFWEEVLVPLGTWTINDAVPTFIDLLSGAISILNPIIEIFKESAKWLWNNFLQPIAEWTGGEIVSILQDFADKLEKIGGWLTEHKDGVEDFLIVLTTLLGALAVAWAVTTLSASAGTLAVGAWNAICTIASAVTTAFGAAVGFLTSPITLVILAIGALIAIVILCIKHWDEIKEAAGKAWEWIKEKWYAAGEWFSTKIVEPIKNLFANLWSKITETFSNINTWFRDKFASALTNIKNVFSPIGSFFSGIWNGIKSTFSNVGNWFRDKFTDAWTKVKNVFSTGGKIFDGIKDGILNGLKSIVNGIIKGINKVVSVPFNGLNNTLNRLRKIEILGAKPFGWVSTFKVPQIPYLAKGAVIPPNAPFAAVLGDQRNGRNLELPESLLRRIVREESGSKGIDGNIELKVYLSGRQVYDEVMRIADLVRVQSGRSPYEAV